MQRRKLVCFLVGCGVILLQDMLCIGWLGCGHKPPHNSLDAKAWACIHGCGCGFLIFELFHCRKQRLYLESALFTAWCRAGSGQRIGPLIMYTVRWPPMENKDFLDQVENEGHVKLGPNDYLTKCSDYLFPSVRSLDENLSMCLDVLLIHCRGGLFATVFSLGLASCQVYVMFACCTKLGWVWPCTSLEANLAKLASCANLTSCFAWCGLVPP